jgi:hypothetical protein
MGYPLETRAFGASEFQRQRPLLPNADCAYQQALDHVKADQFLQSMKLC